VSARVIERLTTARNFFSLYFSFIFIAPAHFGSLALALAIGRPAGDAPVADPCTSATDVDFGVRGACRAVGLLRGEGSRGNRHFLLCRGAAAKFLPGITMRAFCYLSRDPMHVSRQHTQLRLRFYDLTNYAVALLPAPVLYANSGNNLQLRFGPFFASQNRLLNAKLGPCQKSFRTLGKFTLSVIFGRRNNMTVFYSRPILIPQYRNFHPIFVLRISFVTR
jgi:hypothetical protein